MTEDNNNRTVTAPTAFVRILKFGIINLFMKKRATIKLVQIAKKSRSQELLILS